MRKKTPSSDGPTGGRGVQFESLLSPPTSLLAIRLTPSIRRILIVGAGGFGREVLHWARNAWPAEAEKIVGFLAADPHLPASDTRPLPVIADPAMFQPEPGDRFLLAIGIPLVRRRVAEDLIARGGEFLALTHPTAIVAPTASVGIGSIICPGAIVSDAARIGQCGLVNYHASLAHDASMGDFAVLSPYAAIGGEALVGDDVFLGLHASVGPRVTIGDRSKISANSCALHDVPADSLVHGVPGRITPIVS